MTPTDDLFTRADGLVGDALASVADGRLDDAAELLEVATDMFAAAAGSEHPEVAHCLVLRARLARDAGRLDDAERAARSAVAIAEAHVGLDGALLRLRVQAWAERAAIAFAQGRLDDAAEQVAAALGLCADDEAPALLHQLGLVLHHQGRYPEAERRWRRALVLLEGAAGADYRALQQAIVERSLGALRDLRGRAAEAEVLVQRAVALAELPRRATSEAGGDTRLEALVSALGDAEVEAAFMRSCLGAALAAQDKLPAAAAELTVALASQEASLGAAHLDVALTVYYLAYVRLQEGHLDEAEALCSRAAAATAPLGPDHARALSIRRLAEAIEAARADRTSPGIRSLTGVPRRASKL